MNQNPVMVLSVVFIILRNVIFAEAVVEVWCNKTETDCYFTLVVGYGLTMMHEDMLVQAKDGLLYSYDATNFTNAAVHPTDEVITADAYPEPKFMMTFNGTIPGPALHVYEGQTIHLRVINNMMHETTTVHIHGQHQRGTPYSDGVPFVSQCPILPGQTFTHNFFADPKGTFFYHGHSGPQLTNGLYGAFIVHSKEPEMYDLSEFDATLNNHKLDDREHVLFLQDYNHDWDANMITLKMKYGLYKGGKKITGSKTLADIKYSLFHFHSGLINGRGRFYDTSGKHTGGPLSVFTVKQNSYHRFRLVNSGDVYPFRVTIDSHPLLVVATDGADIHPVLVDSVVVNVGERFDVVIRTDQSPRNYLILGQTLEAGVKHTAEAVLNYEGASLNPEPLAIQPSNKRTIVLNCPFSYYQGGFTVCYNLDRIRSRHPNPETSFRGSGFQEYFMNFAFPGLTETPASVNGRSFTSPPFSALTQPDDVMPRCSRKDCGREKICHCPYTVIAKRDVIIQLVLTNLGSGQGWDHPVHLHGHNFQVHAIAYPTYNSSTGKFISQTDDIECNGKFCNEAKWKSSSWENDNVPGIELTHAPTKDTIIVPSGGYVVVRFKADNPGLWIVHCHMGLHFTDGMVTMISEDKPNWPKRPRGFPTCGNYDMTQTEDDANDSDGGLLPFNEAVAVTIGSVVIMLIIGGMILWLYKRKRRVSERRQLDTIDTDILSKEETRTLIH